MFFFSNLGGSQYLAITHRRVLQYFTLFIVSQMYILIFIYNIQLFLGIFIYMCLFFLMLFIHIFFSHHFAHFLKKKGPVFTIKHLGMGTYTFFSRRFREKNHSNIFTYVVYETKSITKHTMEIRCSKPARINFPTKRISPLAILTSHTTTTTMTMTTHTMEIICS